jgi:hypothetical protein
MSTLFESPELYLAIKKTIEKTDVKIGATKVKLSSILNDNDVDSFIVRLANTIPEKEGEKRLAIYGICPFPESCNEWRTCISQRCNADCCSNGFAYRMS